MPAQHQDEKKEIRKNRLYRGDRSATQKWGRHLCLPIRGQGCLRHDVLRAAV